MTIFYDTLIHHLLQHQREIVFCDPITKSRIIKKGPYIHHISNKAFGLHTNAQSKFCQNKYLSYQLLKSGGYRIPNSQWIIPSTSSLAGPDYSLNAAKIWLATHLSPRIIKPNNKSLGRGVQKISSLDEFDLRVQNHPSEVSGGKIDSRVLQEYIPGNDIRVIVLNGQILSCYERRGGQVTGDGIHTIAQHIDLLELNPALEQEVYQYISRHDQDIHIIPSPGKIIRLHDAKNMALGGSAVAFPYTIDDQDRIRHLSDHIGMSYFGLDVITNDNIHKGTILEINSLPSVEGAIMIDPDFEIQFASQIATSIDKLYDK